jgi:hypothetical protein
MQKTLVFAFFFAQISLALVPPLEKARRTCASSERQKYPEEMKDELRYLCALPDRVKQNVPEVYWLGPAEYQKWLEGQSDKPAAPANFGVTREEGDREVNRMVLQPGACHFYSSISPSVQHNKVNGRDPRTRVVSDLDDLLESCRSLALSIEKGAQSKCSVVEFAGHSTQAIGLDTVFSLHGGKPLPSQAGLEKLGKCLRRIAEPKAYVVFSVCGGDRLAGLPKHLGATHYWPGKSVAQKELTQIFRLPILSGVGFVDGTPEGGVTSEKGWYLTKQ